MKILTSRRSSILLAMVFAFAFSGCNVGFIATPYDEGFYYYDYYPGIDVYYDTHYHVYYYRDRGRWIRSSSLPRHYNLRGHRSHSLRMKNAAPYRYHSNWRNYRYDRRDGGRRDRRRY